MNFRRTPPTRPTRWIITLVLVALTVGTCAGLLYLADGHGVEPPVYPGVWK